MRAYIMSAVFLLGLAFVSELKAQEDNENLVTFRNMSPALALKLASSTMSYCADKGYQVAVTIVDRSGLTQVALRDRYAGAHTIETSFRKAWSAVSFRTNTMEFSDVTKAGEPLSGIRAVSQVMAVGGGIPVEAAGSLVGAIGVSGAPGGDLDHECALAGLEVIALDLEF